jgi:hypothetical protein
MKLTEECKKYISKIKKLGKEPKAKKLSGYNLFIKEKSTGLNGSAHQRMKSLGDMWKKLNDKNKKTWNHKAEKLNKSYAKEFDEEQDDQVKELKNLIEETIANFKKNLKNLPKKVKCKTVICENKVPVKKKSNNETCFLTSVANKKSLKKVIDFDDTVDSDDTIDSDEKRKAFQDAIVEWCVNNI